VGRASQSGETALGPDPHAGPRCSGLIACRRWRSHGGRHGSATERGQIGLLPRGRMNIDPAPCPGTNER